MGYVTGTITSATATDDLYQLIRAQLLADGWTEWDVISDIAGSRNIVFRGGPLDPIADNRPVIRIMVVSTTSIAFFCYTDWDPVTHSSMNEGGASGTTFLTTDNATMIYHMRTNSVACAICVRVAANYNKTYFGFLRRGYAPAMAGITKTTAAYASGAVTMNVASDMTGKLMIGQYVTIINNGHNISSGSQYNVQVRAIQAITPTTITFTVPTTKSFDSGAIIGGNPMPVMVGSQGSIVPVGQAYHPTYLDGFYANPTAHTGTVGATMFSGSDTSTDPGDIDNEFSPGIYFVDSGTSTRTGARGIMYHWYTGTMSAPVAPGDIMDAGTAGDQYIVLVAAINATSPIMKTS